MRITVTAEDIKTGHRWHPRKCPIALAMTRAFGVECSVGITIYCVVGKNKTHLLPESAWMFIDAFDNEREVSPFEFDV